MTRQTQRKNRLALPGAASIAPPPERWRRGEIEALPHTIADEEGRPAAPFRAIDTLMQMERRGTITAEMHRAGDSFRDDFALSALDPLRAADMGRVPGMSRGLVLGEMQTAARRRVGEAISALGGFTSPGGSCCWHVLGWQMTVKEWAIREGWGGRPLGEKTAAGILIAALGVLKEHYGH